MVKDVCYYKARITLLITEISLMTKSTVFSQLTRTGDSPLGIVQTRHAKYIHSNADTRSRNHCCRKKAVNVRVQLKYDGTR